MLSPLIDFISFVYVTHKAMAFFRLLFERKGIFERNGNSVFVRLVSMNHVN